MSNSPITIESLKSTNGKRSVTRASFPPGAKALWHIHTEYRETFQVHEGELTVIHGQTKQIVKAGQTSDTIELHKHHRYINHTPSPVLVDIILEPGHTGCEMTNQIVIGLAKDQQLHLLSRAGGYNLLWVVLYDLTNTIITGWKGMVFAGLKGWYGKRRLERERRRLVERYCLNIDTPA